MVLEIINPIFGAVKILVKLMKCNYAIVVTTTALFTPHNSTKESDYEMVSDIWNYMPKSSTKKN